MCVRVFVRHADNAHFTFNCTSHQCNELNTSMNLCSGNTVIHEYIVPIQCLCAFIASIALIDSFTSFKMLYNFSTVHDQFASQWYFVCAFESVSVCVIMSRSIARATAPVFRSINKNEL